MVWDRRGWRQREACILKASLFSVAVLPGPSATPEEACLRGERSRLTWAALGYLLAGGRHILRPYSTRWTARRASFPPSLCEILR